MTERPVVRFRLNGDEVSAAVRTTDTLVDVLQDEFGIRGSRESCGQGLCGCCTVIANGEVIASCLAFAWRYDGAEIVTIEGLATRDELHPVQKAFIEAGAFQCGFCTPGFILMATQLLKENPDPSDEEIRHYLVGNLCRCSAYPEIMAAVRLAAARLR
jgi:carbon-monoxide dehydrogenase small subunit